MTLKEKAVDCGEGARFDVISPYTGAVCTVVLQEGGFFLMEDECPCCSDGPDAYMDWKVTNP